MASNEPAWLNIADDNNVQAGVPATAEPAWLAADAPSTYAVPVAAAVVESSTANPQQQPRTLEQAGNQVAINVAQHEANNRLANAKKDLGKMPKPWLIMRIINPVVAGLLIIAVISALIQSDFFEDFDSVIIALYLIVFALIIICFECCSAICAFALATNFGFMYTIPGRLLFMIMAGILAVSLGTDFGYVMCAVTIAAAVYNAVVMSCYPDWTAKMDEAHKKSVDTAVTQREGPARS